MSAPTTSSSSDRLTEAIAASRAGERDEAQRLLRQLTDDDPANIDAWLWRADLADNSADKRAFLSEVLALDPTNREATLALNRLDEREGPLAQPAGERLACTVHPNRETMLRCNRCGRPMCTECAVRHPVGLRCRECVNQTRSPIYQVSGGTATLAGVVALVAGLLVGVALILFGNLLFAFGPFFGLILTFIVGGALGRFIAGVVQRVVPRKRGRAMVVALSAGILVGALAPALFFWALGAAPNPLLLLVYLGSAISAAAATVR